MNVLESEDRMTDEKKQMTASEMGKRRWEGVTKVERSRFGREAAAIRLAPPEDGEWLDLKKLVKAFGHSRSFFLAALRSGKLSGKKRPAGKWYVKSLDALRFVRAAEAARGKK